MPLDEMSRTIEDLGGYLREHRMTQRMNLADLSACTRIPVRFLEAIEENQFDQLPNSVSARGFLRAYARAVLLSEEPILLRYADLLQQAHPTSPQTEGASEPFIKPSPPREPVSRFVKFGIPLGLLGLVVFSLWISSRRGGRDEERHPADPHPLPQGTQPGPAPLPAEPPAAPPAAPAPAPSPALFPPGSAERADPRIPTSGALVHEPPTVTGGLSSLDSPSPPAPLDAPSADLVLEIEATESSWIDVTIDNGVDREVLLQPGEKVRWRARNQFLLTLGNAGGVKVRYNGSPLDSFGPSGGVVKGILLAR